MTYATPADLVAWCGMNGEAELTELTDPDNVQVNCQIIQDKLLQADVEINSRLVGIGLPIPEPYPCLLVDIACRIARFLLYTTGRPDYVTDDYNLALKMLDDIRTGKASLGLDAYGFGTPGPSLVVPSVSAPEMVFSKHVMEML